MSLTASNFSFCLQLLQTTFAQCVSSIFDFLNTQTPELLWTSRTRSSLRNYLKSQSQILMDSTKPGSYPEWKMKDTFEVKYPSIDGELRAAGVYIRVYLKDPKYGKYSKRRCEQM